MNGCQLYIVNHKKNLGVTVSNDPKQGKHCSDVFKKANKLVGFIGRTSEYKSEKIRTPTNLRCYRFCRLLIYVYRFRLLHSN